MKAENPQQQINQGGNFNQNPPSVNLVLNQRGNFLLIIGIVVLVFVIGAGAYYLGTQKNQSVVNKTEQNSGTSTKVVSPSPITNTNTPKITAFMRDGDIWVKDISTNKESRISKTAAVQSPKLSPMGNYVTYHPIVHAGGGFPRGNLYLTDKSGTLETILGEAGALGSETSRITWSDDDNLIGFVLFQNTGEAKIYDVVEKKVVLEKTINSLPDNVRTIDKSYNANLGCDTLVAKYQAFCAKFQAVLNKDLARSDNAYKIEDFRKSKYTKSNYNLTKSQKLDNGLVILEYYTGEPQNPESQWGIGGGSFFPGYDKGVTETYTILLDEQSDKAILELPRAVDSDFVF